MEEEHCSSYQESQWIELARAGDLPAFNQLVLSHQDAAFRMAKWMINDEAVAEDIVQTVFLAAYGRNRSFHGSRFRSWLLKMIHNACIDELRRRKRHPCLTFEPQDTDSEVMENTQWLIDRRQTPEESLMQHEAWEWIEQCLRQLPEPMREVLILIDLEELDYGETAAVLGVPMGTIKSWLGQARERMRHLLHREHPAPETQEKGNTCNERLYSTGSTSV